MKNSKYRAGVCLSLFLAGAAASGELPPVRAEQVLTEEQRQLQVNTRLESVNQKLSTLADDIRSNELSKELGADKLTALGSSAGKISKTNVLGAANSFSKARSEPGKLKPHLDAADTDIQTAVTELAKLLAGAGNVELESLLAELRVIIKKQDQRKRDTSAWGKQLLEGQANDDNRRLELALLQSQIGPRIQTFHEKLKQLLKDETDEGMKARYDKANTVMVQKPTGGFMTSAIQSIRDKQPIPAVAQQDKILEVLREVEKILDDDFATPLIDLSDLDKTMKDLETLKNELEAATPQEFQTQLSNFQTQQAEINAALAPLDLHAVQVELTAAAEALEKGEQHEAAHHDADALAALHAALHAGEEPGTEPGTEPGLELGIGPPHPALAPHQSLDPKEAPRLFANSTKAEGDRKAPSKALIGALSPREQQSLQENYARELPAEYRGLLEEYYEALSK
jgi:hypothetical protein